MFYYIFIIEITIQSLKPSQRLVQIQYIHQCANLQIQFFAIMSDDNIIFCITENFIMCIYAKLYTFFCLCHTEKIILSHLLKLFVHFVISINFTTTIVRTTSSTARFISIKVSLQSKFGCFLAITSSWAAIVDMYASNASPV